MELAERKARYKLKNLPTGKKYKRLADLFSDYFIKGLDISPSVYCKSNKTEPQEGKENRGTRGMRVKRQFVHNVFIYLFDLAVQEMIETNKVFLFPLHTKRSYMFIGKKTDKDIERLFSKTKGIYSDLNPIDNDFLLYNLYLKPFNHNHTFPIKMDYERYKTLLYRTSRGMRYYDYYVRPNVDINLLRVRDLYNKIFETFPDLDRKVFRRITERGFSRITDLKLKFVPILLSNRVHGINYKL